MNSLSGIVPIASSLIIAAVFFLRGDQFLAVFWAVLGAVCFAIVARRYRADAKSETAITDLEETEGQ